jgi:uncharacterized protein YdeI (BOF family)
MKKFFTFIAVATMALSAMATDFTVYDGTDVNEYIPFRATYFDYAPYCGQVIYPADQLTELVGKDITALTFYIANENGNVMHGGELSFYLAATDMTAFPSFSPSIIPESNFTLVGATAMTAYETEIVVNFETPYTYQGGNLALMVKVTQEGTYLDDGYFYGKNADNLCAAYGWASAYTQSFYPKTTFTYYDAGGNGEVVALISEANALEDNSEFAFNGNAVVTVCKNGYVFLRDASGFAQIQGASGTFENGQVLNQGWTATKVSNDGWVSYTNPAGLSASDETNAEMAAAIKLTGAVDESMLNAYVYVENVNKSFMPIRNLPLPDGTTIGITDCLWASNQPTSGHYNIYGIICKVDGALKFNLVDFETYVEPTWLRGDVDNNGEVKIGDVTALINYLLSGDASAINLLAADCDQNGEIKIGDVTALINYLLSGTW